MKLAVILLSLAAFVVADFSDYNTAYDYFEKVGIPVAKRIQAQEEEYLKNPISRIFNGSPASLGQFKYQAGLVISLVGTTNQAVCGGVLVRQNRVLTAAHCWFDGRNQASQFTVVLGSVMLFSGGTRIQTRDVRMHPNWQPSLVRNDVAVIYLPSSVNPSGNIGLIALPSGSQLNENFAGEVATASGYGTTGNNAPITNNQSLRFGHMTVITNAVCRIHFPLIVHSSHLCTSTSRQSSTCGGDSGGPLAIQRNGAPLLIGLTSFGPGPALGGCEAGLSAAFTRVTEVMGFINQNM